MENGKIVSRYVTIIAHSSLLRLSVREVGGWTTSMGTSILPSTDRP